MLRRFEAKLSPLQDIERGKNGWRSTGGDPQFVARWRRPRKIPPGFYKITASGGRKLGRLKRACLYIDSGQGFNESERVAVMFKETSPDEWTSWVRFDRPVRALRFDPSEGSDRPEFALDALVLEPAARSPQPISSTKVLLNLVRLLPGEHGAGGAGRMCLGLIQTLPDHVQLRVLLPPYHAGLATVNPNAEFIVVPSDNAADLAPHFEWCDCYVDPLNALRPKTIPPDIPVIAILHDLQHMRIPQFFSKSERQARAAEYGYAAARAVRLVAVSEYERENLRLFYGRHQVSVVYNAGFMAEDSGLDDREVRALRAQAGQHAGYLIYSAVPWLHKNHEVLVQAIAILQRRGLSIPLVLTNTYGRAGRGDRLATLIDMLGVGGLVRRKPFIPEQELLDLTINATGMVFPSLYEGFGIPLVDAMQLGVPVIASRLAAIPEICGEAVAYLSNPRNPLAVATDLALFWTEADNRTKLAEAGLQRSKMFSSAQSGKALADAIACAIEDCRRPDGAEGARPTPATPFSPVSVFVLYCDLTEPERYALHAIEDINAFHAAIFGTDARVTVGLDIAYAGDARTEAIFSKAERLVCFNGRSRGAKEFAVQDFALRYDDAEHHVVTRYPACTRQYNPKQIRSLQMALSLHPDANYATIEAGITDCVLHDPPGEIDGVLAFESRRREGAIVYDAMIRRESCGDERHGSFAFLAGLATRARQLGVPTAVRS